MAEKDVRVEISPGMLKMLQEGHAVTIAVSGVHVTLAPTRPQSVQKPKNELRDPEGRLIVG